MICGVLAHCKSRCYGGGRFCDISQNDFGGGEMLSYHEYFSNFAQIFMECTDFYVELMLK